MPIIVKLLNGDLLELNCEDSTDPIINEISKFLDTPKHLIQLIPNPDDETIDYFVIIHETCTIMILNLTASNFFTIDTIDTISDYNDILLELFSKHLDGSSHWKTSDKIVFVPLHLHDYVKAIYGELCV